MKVTNTNQVLREESDSPLFTGGPVSVQPIVTNDMSGDFSVVIVNFSKGARNKFHAHARDQVLIVTEGSGILATDSERRVVGVGDVVHIPAGEKHWHGATADSDFSQFAIMVPRSETTKLED